MQVCGTVIILYENEMDGIADTKGFDVGIKFRKSDEPGGGYDFYTLEHTGMVTSPSLTCSLPFISPIHMF